MSRAPRRGDPLRGAGRFGVPFVPGLLAVWVEPHVWGPGLLLTGAGFALRALFRRRAVV